MLLNLEIQHFAIIDKLILELYEGLNVLTGETGAGKSIIIDSIDAILGGRVSKEQIKTQRDKCFIQAMLKVENENLKNILEEAGIDEEEDHTLIIQREVFVSGRNICRVNGNIITVSLLKKIGECLIDIHGQHDNQSLLRTQSHIELLDSFGGKTIDKLKEEFENVFSKFKDIKLKLKSLLGDSREREQKIDLFKFQIDEIKKADLKNDEENILERQKLIMANSGKIASIMSNAYGLLFGSNDEKSSALDNINKAVAELGNIQSINDKYEVLQKELSGVSYQLEDLIEQIRKERDDVEYDPFELEVIEERLDLLFKLKRKYGNSVSEILDYQNKIEKELEDILNGEELIKSLNSELKFIDERLYEIARNLNMERIKAARVLEEKIKHELDDLEMKKAEIKVEIDFDDEIRLGQRNYNLNGLDRIEFLICANPGESFKPLSKIASGGEMSRVMLAIKTILAKVDYVHTLIFDEIDTGISGRAAQKVAEKLSFISRNHQVICITHLAQIACMADSHYLIEKKVESKNTSTNVIKLEGDGLKDEVARIIGGANISEITLKHAEEMLDVAKSFKSIFI